MTDHRVARLAQTLVEYSVDVREGDCVVIRSPTLAAPLVAELYRRVLAAGAFPETRITIEGQEEAFFERATEAQLDWVNQNDADDIERADVLIHVWASWNERGLAATDPVRHGRFSRARAHLFERRLAREAAGELRVVGAGYPTQAGAQEAGMSLSAYEDFVFRAGLLDTEDPIARWREFGTRLRALSEWLETKRELHLVGEGTDLRVAVEGRRWLPCDGRLNFPDGEVYTAPLEESASGTIAFSYPAIHRGRSVAGVRLRFETGEVVEATATRGQQLLEAMLSVDAGACRVGELAFGLNEAIDRFTGSVLFDEKIGGTAHLALGSAYPECGGTNVSAIHWDFVCDLRQGGEVYADGELVYRDGHFLEGIEL